METLFEIIGEFFLELFLELFSLIGRKLLRADRFTGKKQEIRSIFGCILGIALLASVVAGILILILCGVRSLTGWGLLLIPLLLIGGLLFSSRKDSPEEDCETEEENL